MKELIKIKSTELRLGNLFIEENSNKIIEVIGLEKDRVVFSGMFLDKWQAKPIPLTEEWLVKFGFRKNQNSEKYFLPIPNIKCEIHAERFRGVIVLEIHNHVMPIIPETESSVHGLQNLYFALTGKEINYKQTI